MSAKYAGFNTCRKLFKFSAALWKKNKINTNLASELNYNIWVCLFQTKHRAPKFIDFYEVNAILDNMEYIL